MNILQWCILFLFGPVCLAGPMEDLAHMPDVTLFYQQLIRQQDIQMLLQGAFAQPQGPGMSEFTIFAPTNDAMERFNRKMEDPNLLLKYHIVSGRYDDQTIFNMAQERFSQVDPRQAMPIRAQNNLPTVAVPFQVFYGLGFYGDLPLDVNDTTENAGYGSGGISWLTHTSFNLSNFYDNNLPMNPLMRNQRSIHTRSQFPLTQNTLNQFHSNFSQHPQNVDSRVFQNQKFQQGMPNFGSWNPNNRVGGLRPTINNAFILQSRPMSRGVINVIDQILWPPERRDRSQYKTAFDALEDPQFSRLRQLAERSEYFRSELRSVQHQTWFLPNDQAFASMGSTLAFLLDQSSMNNSDINDFIRAHIIPIVIYPIVMDSNKQILSLVPNKWFTFRKVSQADLSFQIDVISGRYMARILVSRPEEIRVTGNGVVYPISGVLHTPMKTAADELTRSYQYFMNLVQQSGDLELINILQGITNPNVFNSQPMFNITVLVPQQVSIQQLGNSQDLSLNLRRHIIRFPVYVDQLTAPPLATQSYMKQIRYQPGLQNQQVISTPQQPSFTGQQQQLPFGGQQQQSPPFGGQQQSQPPFGGQQQQSPPFGGQQQSQPPFGGQQQQSPPFGGQQQQSPPFGGQQQQSPPFGGQQQQSPPFGGQQQQSPPFGGQQQPQPLFINQQQQLPSGTQQQPPFVGQQHQQTPAGTQQQQLPFGSQQQQQLTNTQQQQQSLFSGQQQGFIAQNPQNPLSNQQGQQNAFLAQQQQQNQYQLPQFQRSTSAFYTQQPRRRRQINPTVNPQFPNQPYVQQPFAGQPITQQFPNQQQPISPQFPNQQQQILPGQFQQPNMNPFPTQSYPQQTVFQNGQVYPTMDPQFSIQAQTSIGPNGPIVSLIGRSSVGAPFTATIINGESNIPLRNGVLHVVRGLLSGTVMSLESALPTIQGASSFGQLLQQTGIFEELRQTGRPNTLFIPSNAALQAMGITNNPNQLRQFVMRHICTDVLLDPITNVIRRSAGYYNRDLVVQQRTVGSVRKKRQDWMSLRRNETGFFNPQGSGVPSNLGPGYFQQQQQGYGGYPASPTPYGSNNQLYNSGSAMGGYGPVNNQPYGTNVNQSMMNPRQFATMMPQNPWNATMNNPLSQRQGTFGMNYPDPQLHQATGYNQIGSIYMSGPQSCISMTGERITVQALKGTQPEGNAPVMSYQNYIVTCCGDQSINSMVQSYNAFPPNVAIYLIGRPLLSLGQTMTNLRSHQSKEMPCNFLLIILLISILFKQVKDH